ncbi:immune-related, lectin-like receptor 1, partial [Silurus asotus]
EDSGHCEKGWKPFGLKCYSFSTTKLTWTQSRDECVVKGGHLVIITSRAEQVSVVTYSAAVYFISLVWVMETHWIGLHDLETEGEWMWVNNQSLNETGIMFWFSAPEGPNEPDNWKIVDSSGENCGALGNESGATSKWFDASCLKLKKFICE